MLYGLGSKGWSCEILCIRLSGGAAKEGGTAENDGVDNVPLRL